MKTTTHAEAFATVINDMEANGTSRVDGCLLTLEQFTAHVAHLALPARTLTRLYADYFAHFDAATLAMRAAAVAAYNAQRSAAVAAQA